MEREDAETAIWVATNERARAKETRNPMVRERKGEQRLRYIKRDKRHGVRGKKGKRGNDGNSRGAEGATHINLSRCERENALDSTGDTGGKEFAARQHSTLKRLIRVAHSVKVLVCNGVT